MTITIDSYTMGSGAAEGKCSRCTKYTLVIFNILFCVIGAGLVAIGAYAYIQTKDYKHFFGDVNIYAPAYLLMVLGGFTFVVAGIGCIGAFKESPCLLFVFATIIGLVLVTELVCGAVAFVYRGDLQKYVEGNAALLMKGYNESVDNAIKEAWDLMHEKLECCGTDGHDGWKNTTIATQQNGMVPRSCKNYTNGCIESFVDIASANVVMLGAAAVVFGLTQMSGIALACVLGCLARKNQNS